MPFNDLIVLVDIEPVLNVQTGKNQLQIVRENEAYAVLTNLIVEKDNRTRAIFAI